MPLYQYLCRDCAKPFELFVTAERKPHCPACQGANLAKLLSRPGMVGTSSARPDNCAMPSAPTCGGGSCGCH